MMLLTHIHIRTHTSSSVPKARSNPPYQTHKCDKGPSVQTNGPDHNNRTAQLHHVWQQVLGNEVGHTGRGLTCKKQ